MTLAGSWTGMPLGGVCRVVWCEGGCVDGVHVVRGGVSIVRALTIAAEEDVFILRPR